ncbi:MAG: hypothetical protein L3K23_02165 [Thermoplasmata archaeon]|nr:hypothetical protein [Thermoplasmata archaeon]
MPPVRGRAATTRVSGKVWRKIAVAWAFLVFVVVPVTYLEGVSVHRPTWITLDVDLVLIPVLAIALLVGIFWAFTRWIEVSNEGLRIGTFLRNEVRVPWKNVQPPRQPYSLGSIVFRSKEGDQEPANPFVLTRAQARAILESPSCPDWHLSPAILTSVGLRADRAS